MNVAVHHQVFFAKQCFLSGPAVRVEFFLHSYTHLDSLAISDYPMGLVSDRWT